MGVGKAWLSVHKITRRVRGIFELKKIGFWKRASALLLDAILLAVLTTGFMWIVSLICGYSKAEDTANRFYEEWETFRKECIKDVAEHYGYTYIEEDDGRYTITKDGEAATLDNVVAALDASKGEDAEVKAEYDRFKELPPAAQVNAQYKYVHTMLFTMVSLGILLAYLVLEFIVPIILKNGQTVGKKVFGICLVRPNCVRITTVSLFARTFLGKFAVETMFPVLLVFLLLFGGMGLLSIILFAALTLLNIVLFFATKNRTPIHDILAYTVAVDMKLQMIFQSDDELNEKKALVQKEFIENQKNV